MRETIAIHGIGYYDWGEEFNASSWAFNDFAVVAHSNDEQWFVVDYDSFFGETGFLRVDWVWGDHEEVAYYICGAGDSEAVSDVAAALEVPASDATDLAFGCSGYNWTPVYYEPTP
jgi:hypothetical protein